MKRQFFYRRSKFESKDAMINSSFVSGYVVFCCNGLTNLAIFNKVFTIWTILFLHLQHRFLSNRNISEIQIYFKCDFYINGHQYSNILEQFVLDREVSLDVIDQPLDDVQFKALTVWIGEKPGTCLIPESSSTTLLTTWMFWREFDKKIRFFVIGIYFNF